jgi:hypothetical protein
LSFKCIASVMQQPTACRARFVFSLQQHQLATTCHVVSSLGSTPDGHKAQLLDQRKIQRL